MSNLPPRFIAERLLLIVAVILAVGYFTAKQFCNLDLNAEMNIILCMLVVLSGDAILANWRRYDDEKAIIDIRDSLNRLEDAAKRAERLINASVSKPPASIEDYKALYSGFTGIYSAYNPSYTNEGKPGLPNEKLIDQIFVPRFAHRDFEKAHYLFFTEDADGKRHLEVFRTLMKKVRDNTQLITDFWDA